MIAVEAKLPMLRIKRLQNSGAGIRTKPDITATKLLRYLMTAFILRPLYPSIISSL